MARGQAHDQVQRENGEWDSYPAAFRLLDEVVEAELRGRMAAGESIHEISDDLDERECNGK